VDNGINKAIQRSLQDAGCISMEKRLDCTSHKLATSIQLVSDNYKPKTVRTL